MEKRFSAILTMALSMGLAALQPLTEYSERSSRSRGYIRQRNAYSHFWRRYNRKYSRPHQGAQEIARRKSQIERGILQVSKP